MSLLSTKGTGRETIAGLAVEWVDAVAAPAWSRHGDAGEAKDTEDFVAALALKAGAPKVRACWQKPKGWKKPEGDSDPAMWMFRAERA